MGDKPIIALTTRGRPFDAGRTEVTTAAFEWITNAYSRSITRAGGVPLLLSNECAPEDIEQIMLQTDGLLLSGGEDVAPEYFGEMVHVDNLTINELRDRVELAAIAVADQLEIPILGICRGIQVLNIARGGNVYQDLAADYKKSPRDHSRGPSRVEVQTHPVSIQPECRLARIVGQTARVATDHHQAIKDLGRDLVAVAHDPEDDVIEAVEQPGERFVVAVQWHPEVRADDPASLELISAFIKAATDYRVQRRQTTIIEGR